ALVTRMIVMGELFGPVAAAALIEHAFRVALTARWAQLPAWLGMPALVTPKDAAGLLAAVASLSDQACEQCIAGPEGRVDFRGEGLFSGLPGMPIAFQEA